MRKLINTTIHIIAQSKRNLVIESRANILISIKRMIKKVLNLKLVIISEYQDKKIFLQKG